ncbi:hypothetical protein H6P81_005020 [Aristolochia fimbriata]|uniref:DUF4378 domain-containing protein n=1 Tax=Aristolochia fimbriata TaxID=158543 RepID=A0AAV7EWU2_ARIFI|nr:hypothetical protein H6P81_005020 [Aristolochia fimbriata]
MGRDWSWTSGGATAARRSTSDGGGKETPVGCISSVLHLFDFHQFPCVSFGAHGHQHEHEHEQQQKLDLHQGALLQQDRDPSKLDGSLSDQTPPPKGLEAPRNSLELQEEGTASSPSSSAMKEDDHQDDENNIPFGVLQLVPLKPSSSPSSDREAKDDTVQRSSPSPIFSDDTNSQGSKTPNLVARLMGLDVLPDEISSATSSPMYRRSSNGKYPQSHQSSSSSSNNALCISCSRRYESGSRSLPDTPRMSSARRSTDVDPRYSLQLNKENNTCNEAAAASYSSPFSTRRLSGSGKIRRDMKLMMAKPQLEDGKISPSKYAREIVRQVKENVSSRKVGADITNYTITAGRGDKRDNNINIEGNSPKLVLLRKNSGGMKLLLVPEAPTQSKHSSSSSSTTTTTTTPSRSPRFIRASKQKPAENQMSLPQIPEINNGYSKPDSHSTDQISKAKAIKPTRSLSSSSSCPMPKPATKCKKASCERFTRKPKKLPPPETLENLRADGLRRTSTTKGKIQVLQGRTVVGSNGEDSPPSSFGMGNIGISYKEVEEAAAAALGVRDEEAEFRYVRTVLEHAGIETGGPPKWWYSASSSGHHPLDRSLFLALERSGGPNGYREGSTRVASYRSLLFDLAGEAVAGILKPRVVTKRLRRLRSGAEVVEAVWGRVRKGFPGANCKTLQDIDALVGLDMTAERAERGEEEGEEDEVEAVVGEIEREVVASLVAETASGLLTGP